MQDPAERRWAGRSRRLHPGDSGASWAQEIRRMVDKRTATAPVTIITSVTANTWITKRIWKASTEDK